MADVSKMNTLNTRIKLKYDTYANWMAKDPVLLEGEVAIAAIPSGTNTNPTMANLPNIVLKVGQKNANGDLQKYSVLPFVSALAADVHGWAKKAAPDITDFTWLPEYVDGRVGELDTDTQYTIQSIEGKPYSFKLMAKNKGEADAAYKQVGVDIDLTNIDSRLDNLEALIGATDGKSVAEQIAGAIEGLSYEGGDFGTNKFVTKVTQNNGEIEASYAQPKIENIENLTETLNNINGEIAKKQDELGIVDGYNKETNKVATAQYVTDTVATSINGLSHTVAGGTAGTIARKVEQVNGEVKVAYEALKQADFGEDVVPMSAVAELDTELGKKQNNLTFMSGSGDKKVATEEEITGINNAISGMALAQKNNNAGDGKVLQYIKQEGGVVTAAFRDLDSSDFKADIIPESAVANLTENLASKQENIVWADGFQYDPANNKAATVNYVANAILDLNGAMHFEGVVTNSSDDFTTFEADVAKHYAEIVGDEPEPGDVVIYGDDEYIYSQDAWVKLGNESIYLTRKEAAEEHTAIRGEIAKKQDELGIVDGYDKETNKVATVNHVNSQISTAINGLNSTSTGTAGTFARTVVQENGEVTVTYKELEAADFNNKTDIIPQAAVSGLTTALNGKQDNLVFMSGTGDKKVATETEIASINQAISEMVEDETAGNGYIISGIKQEAGVVTATSRPLTENDFGENLIKQTSIQGLSASFTNADTAAQGYANTAETNAKNHADTEIGKAIGEIDFAIAPVAGEFVTGFTVEDGKMTASTTSKVDVKYLSQTASEYLVFDCGSASINV